MMRSLAIILAIVLINISCANKKDNHIQDSVSQNDSSTVPKEEEILIPLSRTIEVLTKVEKSNISVIWESERDLVDGSVKDLAIRDSLIYVFGNQFDVDKAPEAYELYKSGNGESIYYYLDNPVYFKAENAFVTSHHLNGDMIKTQNLDFGVIDKISTVNALHDELLFTVWSTNPSNPSDTTISLGLLKDESVSFLVEDSKEFGSFNFIEDYVLDYHFDPETREKYTNIYKYFDGAMNKVSTISIPNMRVGYVIDNKLIGYGVYFDEYSYDLKSYQTSQSKLSFENKSFRQSEKLDFDHVNNKNYASGYIGYDDDFDGFFWSFYDHETDPLYYYFLDDSIELTNQYVTDKGVFFTGQEDGEMLLMFLNRDGEIQWKAHFRDGVIRGIVEQDGRYFIAGDYHIKRTDKERDWGTDYLYLAEIKIN
jgi:hypothetical protein